LGNGNEEAGREKEEKRGEEKEAGNEEGKEEGEEGEEEKAEDGARALRLAFARRAVPSTWLSPKSQMRTSPCDVSSTFSGLRSPCTMPRLWRYFMPAEVTEQSRNTRTHATEGRVVKLESEGGGERGADGWREAGSYRVREGGREQGREEGREEGRVGGRERGREGETTPLL
jgi:hypothetical protein